MTSLRGNMRSQLTCDRPDDLDLKQIRGFGMVACGDHGLAGPYWHGSRRLRAALSIGYDVKASKAVPAGDGGMVGGTIMVMPGIEKAPGVGSGDARVARTRVPVWTVEQARRSGFTDAELLEPYPGLHAADPVAAWKHARPRPAEIEQAIRQNQEA